MSKKKYDKDMGITRSLVAEFNSIWEAKVRAHNELSLLDIGKFCRPEEVIDCRHYDVSLLKEIGREVAAWFRSTPYVALAQDFRQ